MRLDPAAELFALNLQKSSAPKEPSELDNFEEFSGPVRVDTPDMEGPVLGKDEPIRPVTSSNIFRNSAAHPVILYTFMLDKYGPAWLTWDPDAIWLVIEKDFKTSIASITKEKLNAIKTLISVDSFWWVWEVFEKVTQAMNNNIVRFDILQPPTLGQMVNAVRLAKKMRPEMKTFEEEVARYVSAIALEEGVEYLPPPLTFAQPFLGPAPKDVVARYKELSTTPLSKVRFSETAPDIQAAKLLIAVEYANFRERQAKAQAETIAT